MENIGVIFGGKSVEHDISIITALQVMDALPKEYRLIPLYIRSDGVMVTAENLTDAQVYLDYAKNVKREMEVSFITGQQQIYLKAKSKIKKKIKLDVAILCNHGHGGEDGSLQGLLELCSIPYTCPAVASSAVCMDKVLTKIVLKENSIQTPAYVHFSKCQYEENKEEILKKIDKTISPPCIVKPARCGSSVGVSICENEDSYASCIENALLYDDKIIVEKFVENAREFFCAVVKVSDKILPSGIDESRKEKFYTFYEKYFYEKKQTNVKLQKSLSQKIKALAIKTYNVLECEGVVRVDFLYSEKDKTLYVNEVNTIPGSLAFNLFEGKFADLLKVLIIGAKERAQKAKDIVYKFNSQAIEHFINLGKAQKTK